MPRKRKSQPKSGRNREYVRTRAAKLRGLSAIRRVRRGDSRTLTAAARAEGTSVRTIKRLLPLALLPVRSDNRIRVKASDQYSAKIQILSNEGALSVTARGSRQRELAGQHRATFMRVLQGKEPPSALEQYRGKKIGGHELISDFELLSSYAQAGDVGQLEALYVTPDASV